MPKRPKFAVGLGDVNASDWSRTISLLLKRKRQFAKPLLQPVLLDRRKVLTIHSRRAPIGAALGIGMGQDIFAVNLVVQGIEAIAGFSLRFCV